MILKDFEELINLVKKIDLIASNRLKYYISTAIICPKFAKKINFRSHFFSLLLIDWATTPEGFEYWEKIDVAVIDQTPHIETVCKDGSILFSPDYQKIKAELLLNNTE